VSSSASSPQKAREKRIARGAVAHYEDAAYYDFTYRARKNDVAFYAALAAEHGRVLELGVGSGRVAVEAVRRGAELTGVERVPAMLAAAKAKRAQLTPAERARFSLKRGDIRKVRLGRRFPLVISPFNVFMHLYTRRDVEDALATVHAHLAPRGLFVFDVSMPDLRAMLRTPGKLYKGPSFRHPVTGAHYDYFEAFEYDAVREVQMVSMVFQNARELSDMRSLPLSQRQFFPAELEALLHYGGFEITRRCGDFEGSPLGDDSESQIVVARVRARRTR
jgi:SAM-dependent methyltransferase